MYSFLWKKKNTRNWVDWIGRTFHSKCHINFDFSQLPLSFSHPFTSHVQLQCVNKQSAKSGGHVLPNMSTGGLQLQSLIVTEKLPIIEVHG
jgi:hypothetical protein